MRVQTRSRCRPRSLPSKPRPKTNIVLIDSGGATMLTNPCSPSAAPDRPLMLNQRGAQQLPPAGRLAGYGRVTRASASKGFQTDAQARV